MCDGARRAATVGALVTVVACGGPAPEHDQLALLTFNRDIAPLIWQHCGTCHRPGESAPFSLLDYEETRSRARQIVTVTKGGIMPPWLPVPGYGDFAGERRLQPEEISRIEQWVEQGAPEGDPDTRRAPPKWPVGWQLGTPDIVVEPPESYALPESGGDVFRNFVIPIPLESLRYVRGMEVRPGAPNVVHHATMLIDPTRASRRLDAEDPLPGYEGMFSEGAQNPDSHALGWTPGRTPVLEPADIAWRLDKGSDLVVQLHLIPSGKPELVKPSIGFFFADAAPTRMPIDFRLGSKTIDIPAGTSDYTIEDSYTLPVDVEVLSVYPHAHYLAKDMRAWATLPDGRTTWLLWIEQWNFKWQDQYRYTKPVRLPRGTTLTMRYKYDNSAENPRNPRNPPVRVAYGPQSSDEMGDLWIQLLPSTISDAAVLARAYRELELRKNVASAELMVARHPREAKWLNVLGARYLEAGRIQEGEARLEDAVRLMPGHVEAHHNLGLARRQQGRLVDAIAHLRRAAALAPRNDRIHYSLANALQDSGRLDDAIVHFRKSIALNPDAADAHNDLGTALGSRGLLDEAALEFRRALGIQPDYGDAQKNLSAVERLRMAPPRRP
jgi:tetratricopeptide (TPR) repeat protein